MKIHKNDLILVTNGKDRGKTGTVLRIDKAKSTVVIENVNKVKKHVKGRQNVKSDIVQFEAPIAVSNVMLICPNCQKKTRIGYRINKDNHKGRVCKKCNESLDEAREVKKVRK